MGAGATGRKILVVGDTRGRLATGWEENWQAKKERVSSLLPNHPSLQLLGREPISVHQRWHERVEEEQFIREKMINFSKEDKGGLVRAACS